MSEYCVACLIKHDIICKIVWSFADGNIVKSHYKSQRDELWKLHLNHEWYFGIDKCFNQYVMSKKEII